MTDRQRPGLPVRLRAASIVVLALAVGALTVARGRDAAAAASRHVSTTPRATSLDDLVVATAWLAALLAAVMLLACLGLAALDIGWGHRSQLIRTGAERGCPRWSRRLVLAVCGLSLTSPALLGQASGVEDQRGCEPPCSESRSQARLHGLPLPDLPTSLPPRTVTVVQPGDSLWLLARSQLPIDASDALATRSVQRWYAANREIIGPDPDLIFPGTPLTQPEVRP